MEKVKHMDRCMLKTMDELEEVKRGRQLLHYLTKAFSTKRRTESCSQLSLCPGGEGFIKSYWIKNTTTSDNFESLQTFPRPMADVFA